MRVGRRPCCLILAIGLLATIPAVAQETALTTEASTSPSANEPVVPPTRVLPLVTGTCSLAPSSGAFDATQSGDKGKLLGVRFGNCRLERTVDGLNALSVEVRIQFEPAANLSFCSAVSIAFLFEVAPTTPGFNWRGFRKVVTDLALRNMSGNDQNLSLVRLHSGDTKSSYTIEQVLTSRPDVPSFDHIYWGNITLLEAPRTSDFAIELERNTPLVGQGTGKVDFTLGLAVNLTQPRGWCWFQEIDTTTGSAVSKKANLTFAAIP